MRFISTRIAFLFCLICCLTTVRVLGQSTSESDVKKQAQKFFEAGDFTSALPLYSQLLSFYAKDPLYNYRYGVCALEAGNDREKPIPYLEFASKNKEMDNTVFFYLGKAYHLNYRFSSALNAYNTYKIKAPKIDQDKYQVDRQLDMCRNGMELLKNISDLTVIEKKELALSDYFRGYDLSTTGQKLLVKPDDFKTNLDKKKNEESVVVLNPNKGEIYFSSYGDNEKNGKDIYKVRRMSNGEWSNPIRLENVINTAYDEDYPFVSNDGTTLYFCSKGHNSMGGYDVFKSVYNPSNGTWGTPENMDFAINTPDDDILYITDDVNQVAYFSSRRTSGQGKINVYKIKVGPKPPSIALISGVFSTTDENTHPEATITVRDGITKNIIGVYKSDVRTGNYSIPLPSSGTYIFNVESEVSAMKTETVVVPDKKDLGTLQQKISIKNDKLIVENIFEDAAINEANLMALLKAKANLEVNYVAEAKPTVPVEEPKSSNLSNQDLVNIAYQDAKDTKSEADQLRSKSDQAYAVSKSKMDLSKSKLSSAEAIEKVAQTMNNEQLRKSEMDKAAQMKKEAKTNTLQAYAVYTIARNLEEEANAKQAEADQALNYAKELDKAIQINSKESIAQLTAQKNSIQENPSAKNTAESAASDLTEMAENKQQEADAAQSRSKILLTDILEIDLKAETLTKDQAAASDEGVKQDIAKQLNELATQKSEKQQQLNQNYALANQLQQEANDLKSQTEYLASAMDELKSGNANLPAPSAQEKILLGNELAIDLGRANTVAKVEPVLQTNNSDINDNAADAFITTDIGKTPVTADNFAAKMAQAGKITDPVKREEQRNIVRTQMNKNWENDIADLKTKQANSKDKNERAGLQSRITELENLKAMNTPTPEVALATASPNKSVEKTVEQSTSGNVNTAAAPETKAVQENNQNPIASETKPSTTTTQPENQITAADTAKKSTNEPAIAINNPPKVEPPVLEGENANKSNTSTSAPQETAEIVNVEQMETDFDQQLNAANQLTNTEEKAKAMQDLASKWNKLADEKIAANNQQLKLQNSSETIASINSSSKELEELKQKVNSAVAPAPTVTIAQPLAENPASSESKPVTAPVTTENSNTLAGAAMKIEDDRNPVYETKFISEQAKVQARRADRYTAQAAQLKATEDSLTKVLVTINDTAKRAATQNLLVSTQRELYVKRIEALKAYSVANNVEFNENTDQLKRISENNKALDSESSSRAEMLVAEAAYYYNEASIKSDLNKSVTDAALKESEMKKIVELEKTAIEKQRRALTTYGAEPQVLAAATPGASPSTKTENSNSNPTTTGNAVNDESKIESRTNGAAITQPTAGNTTSTDLTPVNPSASNENRSTGSESQPNVASPAKGQDQTASSPVVDEKSVAATIKTDSSATAAATTTAAQIPTTAIEERERAFVYPTDTMVSTLKVTPLVKDSVVSSPYYNYYNNLLVTATQNMQQSSYFESRSKTLKEQAVKDSLQAEELIAQASKVNDTVRMQQLIGKAAEFTFNSGQAKIASDSSYRASKGLAMAAIQNKGAAAKYIERLSESDRDRLVAVMNNKVQPDASAVAPVLAQNQVNKVEENKSNAVASTELAENKIAPQPELAQNKGNEEPAKTEATPVKQEENQNKPAEPLARVEEPKATVEEPKVNAEQPKATIEEPKEVVEEPKAVSEQPVANREEKAVPAAELKTANTDLVESSNQPAATNALAAVVNDKNELVKDVVFTKVNKAVYNKNNPIPINTVQPSGIIFKVQIGAFRNPIPQDLFKGFDPISGETTPSGITRYTAGYFKNFEAANAAKRDINNIGYKDAFVVAFCSGKRISIPEATAMIREGRTCAGTVLAENKIATPVVQNATETKPAPQNQTGTLASNAIRIQKENEGEKNGTAKSTDSVVVKIDTGRVEPVAVKASAPIVEESNAGPVAPSVSFEEVKGLVYTVQVGVYSKPILANQLFNIQPLYFERTASGLYRYTSGIFDNLEIANQAKANIVGIGVKDAFVTTYYNGNRIPVEQAKKLESEQGKAIFATSANMNKMPETNSNAKITGLNTAVPTQRIEKQNASLTNEGANKIALPVEGLKNQSNTGIVFKVQIGVFRSEVPLEIAAIYLKLSSRGIEHYQTSDSLTIYTIGNFRDFNSANSLKDEVIQQGLPDAFVVAFKAGNKMKIEDAIKEVNRK